ncbi:MAG: hydantoinase/oxoprolinase family protein [Gemmataceae bacterium]
MPPTTLGLDIGGANLKAAHGAGSARSVPFPLWRQPDQLTEALGRLLAYFPPFERLAITMTGELCDCYASKRDGVNAILDAVETARGRHPARVWSNTGRFVSMQQARDTPHNVASANWLGLATWAGRFAPSGQALMVDLGTTTTDLLVLRDGIPQPTGRTDPDRLRTGELVYRGWKRTPLCALAPAHHAAEFFATMHDVLLVLRRIPEDNTDRATADGQPATREAAELRLARMCCADLDSTSRAERQSLAQEYLDRFVDELVSAIQRLGSDAGQVLTSGSGEFLLPTLLHQAGLGDLPLISLADHLGSAASEAACAHAIACLLAEEEG